MIFGLAAAAQLVGVVGICMYIFLVYGCMAFVVCGQLKIFLLLLI